MRLRLRSCDIATTADRLRLLQSAVKNRFPARWDDSGVVTVRLADIQEFLLNNSIKVIYANMLGKKGEAFVCRVPGPDGKGGQVAVVINELILQLPPPAVERTTKSILLHEICHYLGAHPGARVYKRSAEDEVLQESFRNYQANEAGQNSDAELMAAILAFWPNEEFVRQMVKTQANFRQMANFYKMPVDCLMKWTVLQFYDELWIHYFKKDILRDQIVDSFRETEDWIFNDPHTAVCRSIREKMDTVSDNPKYPCVCRAYYEDRNLHYNKDADQVIVVGLNRKSFSEFSMRKIA